MKWMFVIISTPCGIKVIFIDRFVPPWSILCFPKPPFIEGSVPDSSTTAALISQFRTFRKQATKASSMFSGKFGKYWSADPTGVLPGFSLS